MKEKKL